MTFKNTFFYKVRYVFYFYWNIKSKHKIYNLASSYFLLSCTARVFIHKYTENKKKRLFTKSQQNMVYGGKKLIFHERNVLNLSNA